MLPHPKGLHHDHIDGSIAVADIIADLYALREMAFPFPSREAWIAFMQDSSVNIVKRFSTVTNVLQTREALRRLGYAYGKRRATEGYEYIEGKFAPQYHTKDGLSLKEVADAMIEGLRAAEKEHEIQIVPVICIGREATPAQGIEIAKVVLEYEGEAVLDLACDEPGNPPEKHLPAYRLTFGTKVRRDCHAGEWVSPEPKENYFERLTKNLRTAIFDLKCHSVGHAIPLGQNSDLVDYAAAEGIRITGCPLSNLALGHVKDLRELKIDYLLDKGVIYTLNPDDDLFLPAMPKVLRVCDEAYGFTESHCRALEENVFRGALRQS